MRWGCEMKTKEKHYQVDCGQRILVFATFEEAVSFCNEVANKTKYILSVTETEKKVNHEYHL